MERKQAEGVWIELDEGFLPESMAIERDLDPPEVDVSVTICSDMGRPILIERMCVDVAGNSAYTGDVKLADGAELPGRQVLDACGTLDVGRLKVAAAVRHVPGGAAGESTVPFGLYAWVDWRSDGAAYSSKPTTLQAYEPTAFATGEDGFTLEVVD